MQNVIAAREKDIAGPVAFLPLASGAPAVARRDGRAALNAEKLLIIFGK